MVETQGKEGYADPTMDKDNLDLKALKVDLGPPRPNYLLRLEKHFSKPRYRAALDLGTIGFFTFLIIGPLFSIIASVMINWGDIYHTIFIDELTGNRQWQIISTSLVRSFEISTIATFIDLLIGLPMAFILTRYKFKGHRILDTLVDLPMAVPTSALGFSLYLFWGTSFGISGLLGLDAGLFSPGPILIILTHVAFTYPFIVRNLKVSFQETSKKYEEAAKTLGAPGFTIFRTISLPLAKEGIIAGTILAFTRSLGETGATIIVSGLFETAPLVVVAQRQAMNFPAAAFLSMILIIISVTMLMILRVFSRKVGFPVQKVLPSIEKKLSTRPVKIFRNSLGLILFIVIVLVPAMYTIPFVVSWFYYNPYTSSPLSGDFDSTGTIVSSLFGSDNKWAWLWVSTINSILIAGISTFVGLVFGIPMAMILVKRKGKIWSKVRELLDAMIDIPLIVPTAALGFAMFLFWGPYGLDLFQPGFLLI
ncbi:MAG: ABC transporter permease subunit, partial [Promethearchaeota archaeon]